MLDIFRLGFMASALIAVGVAAAVAQPEWAADWRGAEGNFLFLPSGTTRQAKQADKYHQALLRRLRTKDRITKELIKGRLTLFEAAAAFQRLNAEYPVVSGPPEQADSSPEEIACHQVIQWAYLRTSESDGEEADRFITHLESELRHYKEQHRGLPLPSEEDTDPSVRQSYDTE